MNAIKGIEEISDTQRTSRVYLLGMKNDTVEATERLIRVCAERRGKAVELRVHYEKVCVNGCDSFRVFSVEDVSFGTSTD
jgi:hypothetical protein